MSCSQCLRKCVFTFESGSIFEVHYRMTYSMETGNYGVELTKYENDKETECVRLMELSPDLPRVDEFLIKLFRHSATPASLSDLLENNVLTLC